MKRYFLLALLLLPLACSKVSVDEPEQETQPADQTDYYANLFAFNNMKAYYLWADEMAEQISNWTYGDKPIEKVASLRYRDAGGNLVDRWTELMEDCSSFMSSVTGNGKTFGMEFVLWGVQNSNDVVMVVTFTYEGSPARLAGLKRGDVITTLDGQTINRDNYVELLTEKIYNYPGTLKLGLRGGSDVQMTAVQMYSNPVHLAKTLEAGGKKMGYLHFTNFTMDACLALEQAFRQFKADGIEELVLDLRYNTGGYSTTAAVLGSMIAPPSVVEEGAVFNKEVYNSTLSSSMSEETRFAKTFTLTFSNSKQTVNALAANPGIKKLWVITTGHSASASESLICGLIPYMDVTLVGSTTYGKFCGGYLITAEDWYDYLAKEDTKIDCAAGKNSTEGWGIYVIASRYADCNGVTLSMPSGIPVPDDHYAEDSPRDGFDLGDPRESMLAAVLAHADGKPLVAAPVKSPAPWQEVPFVKPGEGALLW